MDALMCDLDIPQNDRLYVLKRLASEGITFLTKELPKISKAVIQSLESGYFDRSNLTSFKFSFSTLKFCSELLNRIFDKWTGKLLPDSNGVDVGIIVQLCEYSYKLAIPYERRQENEAIENFLQNEEELLEIGRDPEVLEFANQLRKDFETYWPQTCGTEVGDIFRKFRPRPTNGTFVGSDDMYYLYRQSKDRDGMYPFDVEAYKGFFKPYEGCKNVALKSVHEPSFSELLLVPKDSRGPRTICREHLVRVETQMAYFDFMCDELNRYSEGAINFTDQLVNRKIAEESSVSKSFSTLDLRDASDRVSISVVKTVFRNSRLYFFVTGSRRATHVKVNGEMRQLNKLAGMGSGLTFPTMSLLISLAICRVVKNTCPNLRYEDIRKNVFVYGDDICVPSEWAPAAYIGLANIGLKVNKNKSFVKGNFRESCGGDYYKGFCVTPIRLKLTNAKVNVETPGVLRISDSANAFKELYEHSKEAWKKGFKNLTKYYVSILNSFYKTKFGSKMIAGKFDEQCDLPVDYTKGTTHLDVALTSVIYTVAPERIRGIDERKFISKNGRVLTRSPYQYLKGNLSARTRDVPVFSLRDGRWCTASDIDTKVKESINESRTNPKISSRFSELTIPRKLTFVKTSVTNDYLIENHPFSREDWQRKISSDRICTVLAYYLYAVNLPYGVHF